MKGVYETSMLILAAFILTWKSWEPMNYPSSMRGKIQQHASYRATVNALWES